MRVRVSDLTAGDKVGTGDYWAAFVAAGPHPLWPKLSLVVWRLQGGVYSFDALLSNQYIGELLPQTKQEKEVTLRWSLGIEI